MRNEILEQLANVLKALRKVANLTQEDVAQKAGVSRQTIIGIEKGSITSIASIMAVIGVYMLIASPMVKALIAAARLPALIERLLKNK